MNFRESIALRPLLADGAMGTQIYARGVDFDQCFEILNVDRPELIADIHRAYAAAGADLIETNTFGGNRIRMESTGAGKRVAEVNARGVEIARAAAREVRAEVLIAASIGPTGGRMAPLGTLRAEEVYLVYREQIEALAEAGADVLMFETFSDPAEIEQALRAAKDVCALPIVAHMTFTREGRTLTGHSPAQVALRLHELGADVVGANCSTGPRGVLDVVSAMRNALGEQAALSAIPNAGFPEQRGERLAYPATPGYFGEYVNRFTSAGVRLVGGCCGTTPEHIRSMRHQLDSNVATARPAASTHAVLGYETAELSRAPGEGSALAQALAGDGFITTVEVEPPKSADTVALEDTARMLGAAGATVLDISDMPMARMRMSGMAAAYRVQIGATIETVLHFPVRGRNLLRVQGDLLAAHALGIRNLFVAMGDPASIGDHPHAFDHHDIVPTGLVQLIKDKFNHGYDSTGASIGQPCGFTVGVAANLTPADFDKEAKLLKKKIDCGADFALTQPVFDVEVAKAFLAHYELQHGPLRLPVLVGILPLASVRHAEFMRNEVPGVMMPEQIVKRLAGAGVKTRTEGAAIAIEILTQIRPFVRGAYIIPAFGRYDIAANIIRAMAR